MKSVDIGFIQISSEELHRLDNRLNCVHGREGDSNGCSLECWFLSGGHTPFLSTAEIIDILASMAASNGSWPTVDHRIFEVKLCEISGYMA